MKARHVIILGAIFVILLAALAAKKVFMRPDVAKEEYASLAVSLTPEEAYAVEAASGKDGSPFRIERDTLGVWRIPSQGGIRADKANVEDLLRSIAGLKGELRSRQEALFPDYGISDDEAFSIKVFDKDGNAKEALLIGAKRPGDGTSFLRRAGAADVFLTATDLPASFGIYGEEKGAVIPADRWIDLSLADVDPEAVTSIKIVRLENGSEAVRADVVKKFDEEKGLNRWIAQGKEPLPVIDAAKVRTFLTGLKGVKAAKTVDAASGDCGFDKPYLKVSLGTANGPLEFIVGSEDKKDSGDRYVKNPEGRVYLARRYAVTKFDVDVSAFVAEPPPKAEEPESETPKAEVKQ